MFNGKVCGLLVLAALAAALGAAPASAQSAAFDAPPAATDAASVSLPAVIATPLFLLGEVDVSTLGASQADTANAGTDGASPEANADGYPNQLTVDDDHAQCPEAQFTSIQAAVAVAGPGDRVKVCPGTYNEQVRIRPDQDGLTIWSQVPWQAVIKAPPVMTLPNSIVLDDGAHDVALRMFTITGPFTAPGCVGPLERHTGVRVSNGGSMLIYGNHITNIRDINPGFFGCQDGIGVLVGRSLESQVGTAWLRNNLIDRYEKGGVVVDGAGSYAQIDHNVITGEGLSNITAQNGVQVGRGAGADVEHNRISGNQFARVGSMDTAAGVLLFETSAAVEVGHNDVGSNGVGIDIDENAVGLTVDHNDVHDNINDGIGAFQDSMHNWITENRAYNNAPVDCYDETAGDGTGGTANYWVHDQGNTENRPYLCKRTG